MPEKKKVSVNIPKVKFDSKLYVPILVVLLIVAAFLLGVLITKVQYLEGGGSVNTAVDASDLAPTDDGSGVGTEPVDVEIGHLPVLGDKDAKVTIVEFSDFQCPFCESLWKDTLPQIKKDYVDTGKVKFAYRHYPLTSIHPNAQKAAEASECANEQGKFWEYHDELFGNQSEWEALPAADALESFVEYAGNVGINGANLKSCVDSGKYAKAVTEDLDAGTAAGVTGTPATFVNGLLISGAVPYETFKTTIDQELAK